MSGTAFLMISPSMVRAMRSTPWVDGCWGPMLMNIWSVLIPPTVSLFAGAAGVWRSLIEAVLDVDVVFAQGMPLQEIGGQDLGQVRMALVVHAEQVEVLPLLP